jgi:hypothetical protein
VLTKDLACKQILRAICLCLGLSVALSAAFVAQDATASSGKEQKPIEVPVPIVLQSAHVSMTVNALSLPDSMVELVSAAEEHNAQIVACKAYLNRFNGRKSRIGARANDALNFVFMFQGVSTSSEAGDVILDEKLKLKSLGSAKYVMRKLEDQSELRVLTNAIDLAATLGNKRTASNQKLLAERRKSLEDLVGAEAAARYVECLQSISDQCAPEFCSPSTLTSQSDLEQRIHLAVQTAALNDKVADEVRADIHKYNDHSPTVMALHRIARTTLSIISLTPNFAGPAAQAVLFGYVVVSGGSECSKVLKEMYLGKRLESRVSTLTEEMHVLFDGYRLGANGANNLLATCSEQLLGQKIGDPTAMTLLKETDYSNIKVAADENLAKQLSHLTKDRNKPSAQASEIVAGSSESIASKSDSITKDRDKPPAQASEIVAGSSESTASKSDKIAEQPDEPHPTGTMMLQLVPLLPQAPRLVPQLVTETSAVQ